MDQTIFDWPATAGAHRKLSFLAVCPKEACSVRSSSVWWSTAICPNSDIPKFADDVTLLQYVRDPEDGWLSDEWRNITAWSSGVDLSLNIGKYSVMNFPWTKRDLRLQLIAEIVKRNFTKISGSTFSSDLSWNKHIDEVVSKADKRIYIIRNLKRSGYPPVVLHRIFKSILLYSFPVFCNLPCLFDGTGCESRETHFEAHRKRYSLMSHSWCRTAMKEIVSEHFECFRTSSSGTFSSSYSSASK